MLNNDYSMISDINNMLNNDYSTFVNMNINE